MNHLDYSEVKSLLNQYKEKFATLDIITKDLFLELKIKIDTLDQISIEIVDLVNDLISDNEGFSIDKTGKLTWRGMSVQLQPTSDMPIQFEKVGNAFTLDAENQMSDDVNKKKKEKLERLSVEFYQVAHKVTHIPENLPKLKDYKKEFNSSGIRIVRNNLIEHSEKSGVTHNSFAYTKVDGPYIKGLRRGNQLQHQDVGFKKNSDELILILTEALKYALT